MQKIDSVGDERAETPNKGHWGNPKINNSRKPPLPTTDGIKGKGSVPSTSGSWNHSLAHLPRVGFIKLLAGKEEERYPGLFLPIAPSTIQSEKHGNQSCLLTQSRAGGGQGRGVRASRSRTHTSYNYLLWWGWWKGVRTGSEERNVE